MALEVMEETLNNPKLCQDFEESVQRELENKKYEYKGWLLQWDQISTELLRKNQGKSLYSISESHGFKQVDLMIRSQIRSSEGKQW
jgi:hypothetical protein